ncbi:MAG TPA: NAD-dependent epimerase/dehydratase family protein [Candidatus Krumholzibacteria bacterium]|nr:NAD-dependent epimerase/dehydratase family protein [Candidatus Krumholzibacteria bacterium]
MLVTGATGFIGRHVCAALTGVAWVRAAWRSQAPAGNCDEAVRVDLSGPLPPALLDGIDTILHCAGMAHAHGVRLDDDAAFEADNVVATRNLCAAASAGGVRRVVIASSVAVFGTPGAAPVAEDAAPAPDSAYARSKLAAERAVQASVPEPVVLRFPLVYGPGLPGNLARMVDAIARRRFPPLPRVCNRRSMIHVEDAARAMVLAGGHPAAAGRTFTVSDGQVYSTSQMAGWIRAALGRRAGGMAPPLAVFSLVAAAGDRVAAVSGRRAPVDGDAYRKIFGSAEYASSRIATELGFEPRWDLPRAMPGIVAARRNRSDKP